MADPKNVEDLSDEEISKMTPEAFAAMAAATGFGTDDGGEGNGEDENANANTDAAAAAAQAAEDAAAQAAAALEDANEDAAAQKASQTNGVETSTGVDAKAAPADANKAAAVAEVDADGKAKVDPAESATVNHEEQIKALFAPFKANGRDMQVQSVEEARQLMSMGANYSKKMQAMKPHLATLRTLENAKIGEAELNFLIDVHNRVPEAINKLVKDSGIDPLDLSPEKADGYRPQNHKASDKEVELDSVLQDLQGSDGIAKTVNIVSKEWDQASRVIVAEHPQLLKIINDHVETGIYDQIAAEVDRERTFGRLTGLSDLEAYRQVGDAMDKAGKFVHKGGSATTTGQQTAAPQVIKAPDPKKADDSKRNAQKRGVAPVKGGAASVDLTQNPDFNPLSMSDEDFAKQFAGKKF